MPFDLQIDANRNAAIDAGDFLIEESTIQHQQHLLVLNKGDVKEHPTACVGIGRYLKDDEPLLVLGEIKREFEVDGMRVDEVSITAAGNLNVKAMYAND